MFLFFRLFWGNSIDDEERSSKKSARFKHETSDSTSKILHHLNNSLNYDTIRQWIRIVILTTNSLVISFTHPVTPSSLK